MEIVVLNQGEDTAFNIRRRCSERYTGNDHRLQRLFEGSHNDLKNQKLLNDMRQALEISRDTDSAKIALDLQCASHLYIVRTYQIQSAIFL